MENQDKLVKLEIRDQKIKNAIQANKYSFFVFLILAVLLSYGFLAG